MQLDDFVRIEFKNLNLETCRNQRKTAYWIKRQIFESEEYNEVKAVVDHTREELNKLLDEPER